ncbi:SWIM zinc finger family protein [Streptomyces sp. I05A-00742]|uniref:SWIM zinc finger family protein n=1 Tax=Streptomyces sp. I05A-00742 TaxID=2732853 RepID=UPI00148A0A04|nr:SWIM zinc finger family protein [Streptomyces sp. I05A-00742]
MNPQGERWTADQVLALAPDAASRTAGGRLAVPGSWSGTGARPDAVWGECAGSGSRSYQAAADLADPNRPGYRCGCPSRKVPCKHVLGLLLLWAAGEEAVPPADEPPPWAGEWLDKRRRRSEPPPGEGTSASSSAAADRRAAARAGRIADGVAELERRLADMVHGGLATSGGGERALWDRTAARMVDAQAPGLASRVRELGTLPGSGPDWASRLLEECALLHTLNRAYARVDRLPPGLAATVRTRVGISVDAATVLASAKPVRDDWLVLSQYDDVGDTLTTRRIWLHGGRTGRTALVLSYGAGGRAPELSLPAGLSLDADLAFHPAAVPLRAALGARYGAPAPGAEPPRGTGVEAALAAYGTALRDDPWLDAWPVVLDGVIPVPDAEHGWQLADADGGAALAVDARHADDTGLWRLMAVSAGGPVRVFGECGHRGFAPLAFWGPDLMPLRE